ncbi:MAG TPA: PIG-L deacetylase family protein [Anaeromyxobacteraceae bacterium]|nr:PIG-L deacetylase family protein [Anaeromyxobacteraceae bacterium]
MSWLGQESGPRRVLALGAHADDIEIGCGGLFLRLVAEQPDLEVMWVVFCAPGPRKNEASASASAFLAKACEYRLLVHDYRDGFLPYSGAAIKEACEQVKDAFSPDLVLTHFREDRHQDHRLVSDLTWNTWRDHMILEYEIPKYDGDFGSPNWFVPMPAVTLGRKIELILQHFPSQARKHWLDGDLLRAVARIRGMECVATEGLAEAFYCRKVVV